MKNDFIPDWFRKAPPEGSYRSILKWGDPNEFKHPNKKLYELMKNVFNMTDEDFTNEPDKNNIKIYRHLYSRVYKKIYPKLREIYDEIQKITMYPEIY